MTWGTSNTNANTNANINANTYTNTNTRLPLLWEAWVKAQFVAGS